MEVRRILLRFERRCSTLFSLPRNSAAELVGLSTALGIVKSYRGFMNLTSEVGCGSNFEVYFPANFSASSNLEKLPLKELPRGNGELILVIDDEATIRQVVQQTLETFGYGVVSADSRDEALSIYAQRKREIAAVITDMMMPILNGVPTTEALRRLNRR